MRNEPFVDAGLGPLKDLDQVPTGEKKIRNDTHCALRAYYVSSPTPFQADSSPCLCNFNAFIRYQQLKCCYS